MIRLNLLPKNLRRRVEPGWWRLAAGLFVVATLSVVGYLYFSTVSQIRALENQRDELRLEVESLKPFVAEQNTLERKRTELEKLLSIKKQLAERFVAWSDNLAAVINQIPREGGRFGIALKKIGTRLLTSEESQKLAQSNVYDGKQVKLEFDLDGEAQGQASLVRFIKAFEESPSFGINFNQASLNNQNGLYSFSTTVGLVGEPVQGGGQSAR